MSNVLLLLFLINILVVNFLLVSKGEKRLIALLLNFTADIVYMMNSFSFVSYIVIALIKVIVILYLFRVKYVYDFFVSCDYYFYKIHIGTETIAKTLLGVMPPVQVVKDKIYNMKVSNFFAFIVAAILFSITSGVLYYANK